jgi:IS5 family transposase
LAFLGKVCKTPGFDEVLGYRGKRWTSEGYDDAMGPRIEAVKHKGGKWYCGMKAHIRVDAESGLVHTVVGTAANVHESLKKIEGPRP